MKIILLCVFVAALVALCLATSQPVLYFTRAEGCIDGVCGPHCATDGAKIFPGKTLNNPGKCELLYCADDFSIRITPCPFDYTGKTEYVNRDYTKLYPECCGTQQNRQTD